MELLQKSCRGYKIREKRNYREGVHGFIREFIYWEGIQGILEMEFTVLYKCDTGLHRKVNTGLVGKAFTGKECTKEGMQELENGLKLLKGRYAGIICGRNTRDY
jgi:hypothetical protein